MYDWLLIIKIAAALALGVLIVVVGIRLGRHRKAAQLQAAAARRAELQKAATEKPGRKRSLEDSMALLQVKAEQTAAERAAAERASAERAMTERAAADKALAEWIAAEEAEQRRAATLLAAAEQVESEKAETQRAATERAIAEWMTAIQSEVETSRLPRSRPVLKDGMKARKIDAIKEQVFALAQQLEKEMNDVEFITNEIQAKVDFLPLEVQHTIGKWKRGEAYKRDTFQDLKLRFRYQAFSIQDGWDVYYGYCDWIVRQRQKILIFVRLLGTAAKPAEDIVQTLERAQRTEWDKHLDLDMDVVFLLKEMKAMLGKMDEMKHRLESLEAVCKKRSEQVIRPSWDPKGSL